MLSTALLYIIQTIIRILNPNSQFCISLFKFFDIEKSRLIFHVCIYICTYMYMYMIGYENQ